MTTPLNRCAIIMLTSGLSRRYGWKDKLLEELGGKHLMEHAASVIMSVEALVRVAVCPADKPEISDRLIERFVVALNKKPKMGLGHSIAVGVDVALKFKPDAMIFCMADMPFVEGWIIENLAMRLGGSGGAEVVHCGGTDGVRPPTAFSASCFEELRALDGDDGAKRIIASGRHNVLGISAPAPLLFDVDTRDDLDLARKQFEIRERHEPGKRTSAQADDSQLPAMTLQHPDESDGAGLRQSGFAARR
ncbi:MAG TPA: nucleotidyltransferase family protein [Hyphomonadaceae bacterium]|nr:nucleotidyltransferase family protein [Hyphomonadaceae bacterium]